MGFLDDATDWIGDAVGGFTGISGAEAAEDAGARQAAAMLEASRIAAGQQQRGVDALVEQLGITREGFAPFLEAGTGALDDLQRSATVGGLDEQLAQIMGGGAFGSLVGERQRAIEGQLSAGGLTRSNEAISAASGIPADLAFSIENLLSGRQQGLVDTGLSAAATSGGHSGGMTSQISDMLAGLGQTQGAGITGSANAVAAGMLGGAQSRAQGAQNMGGLMMAIFSDPRLKENIEIIGSAGPLDIVTWDWKPEFKDTIVHDFNTVGFLSTQVREHYPEFVGEFGGYDVINYQALHQELKKWH